MQVGHLDRLSALINAFSSSGGEGARRADEEVFVRFQSDAIRYTVFTYDILK